MASNIEGLSEVGGKQGLLFIPDISGFTDFISETDAVHSTHIISELIEVIIDSQELPIAPVEIEGDAVLFYGEGPAPSLDAIVAQAEKTFLAFHRHLQYYERDRICGCGSCETANHLTLKFVVHNGSVVRREIRNLSSLLGPDVTIAHRLMKNDIDSHEYLLLSDGYLNQLETSLETSALSLSKSSSTYQGIGEIGYQYGLLSHLYDRVGEIEARPALKRYENPMLLNIVVNAPLERVKSVLLDLEQKRNWVRGMKDISYDEEKVERVGSAHNCVLTMGTMNVEAAEYQEFDGGIEYAERVVNHKRLPDITTIFRVQKLPGRDSCEIQVEWHVPTDQKKGLFLVKLLRPIFRMNMKQSLKRFRRLVENMPNQPMMMPT